MESCIQRITTMMDHLYLQRWSVSIPIRLFVKIVEFQNLLNNYSLSIQFCFFNKIIVFVTTVLNEAEFWSSFVWESNKCWFTSSFLRSIILKISWKWNCQDCFWEQFLPIQWREPLVILESSTPAVMSTFDQENPGLFRIFDKMSQKN